MSKQPENHFTDADAERLGYDPHGSAPTPPKPVKKGLAAIEEAYGFAFGDPVGEAKNSTGVPITGTVSCVTPTCPRKGEMHAIYADTPLPLHCGDCHVILAVATDATDASQNTEPPANVEDHILDAIVDRVIARMKADKHK